MGLRIPRRWSKATPRFSPKRQGEAKKAWPRRPGLRAMHNVRCHCNPLSSRWVTLTNGFLLLRLPNQVPNERLPSIVLMAAGARGMAVRGMSFSIERVPCLGKLSKRYGLGLA